MATANDVAPHYSLSDDVRGTMWQGRQRKTTIHLPQLTRFSWTTRIVLVLAAFASQYGDFCYIVITTWDNRNVKVKGLLKGLKALKRQLILDEPKRSVMAKVNILAKNVLELTSRFVRLSKLKTDHLNAFENIPARSCQTIIVVFAAAVHFTRLIDFEDRYA